MIEYLELWQCLRKANNRNNKEEVLLYTNKLIEIYYPLIKPIAYRKANQYNFKISVDELHSFGVTGLYTAIRKFDYDLGLHFNTYATTKIAFSMIDEMRNTDKVPISNRLHFKKYEKVKRDLEDKLQRIVTDTEIFEILEKTDNVLKKMPLIEKIRRYKPENAISLSGSDLSEEHDYEADFDDNLIDKNIPQPDEAIQRTELHKQLINAINLFFREKIRKRNISIYINYFINNLTMQQVGDKVNLSESRVSQIVKEQIKPFIIYYLSNNPSIFGMDLSSVQVDKELIEELLEANTENEQEIEEKINKIKRHKYYIKNQNKLKAYSKDNCDKEYQKEYQKEYRANKKNKKKAKMYQKSYQKKYYIKKKIKEGLK